MHFGVEKKIHAGGNNGWYDNNQLAAMYQDTCHGNDVTNGTYA